MNIDPKHCRLVELLSNRLFKIPQYQRAYSWGTKQRKDLFNDIRKSYLAKNDNDHFMATIVGLRRKKISIGTDEFQEIDIVDGQQRLTTLILLFKATAEALDRSKRDQKKSGEQIDEILVKQDKTSPLLLQTNHDGSEYFADYIRNGKETDYNKAEKLADREILLAIKECKTFVKKWQDGGYHLNDLVAHLKNRLTFIFHEIGDERLVYTVFEVLNSRGLAVSWFDRLKSMLMSIVFEAGGGNKDETIKEIHELWADIYGIIGLRQGLSTESLRFAATLWSEGSGHPLGEEDAVQLLLNESERKPEKVIEVTKWVKLVTKAVDELTADQRRNAVTKILQARLVAVAVNLRSDLPAEDKSKILRRWENVTFRIYGMHGKDSRTAVGAYRGLASRIIKRKLSIEKIMDELSDIGKKYPCDKAANQLQKENCYEHWKEELRYFFRRYEEHLAKEGGRNFENEHWSHIWKSSASDSIEHILPQKTEKTYLHWLGNLLILPPRLNSKLKAKQPKDKASAYAETGLLIAGDVANRITNVGKWRRSDIIKREEELIKWAKKEWAD